MFKQNHKFSIFFGDSKTSPFSIEEYRYIVFNTEEDLRNNLIQKIEQKFNLNSYFLHQIHGNEGQIITSNNSDKSFYKQGDYLITNIKNLAIGILTADCLPILFYDTTNNLIAIAHAGWRGSVANIAKVVTEKMINNFNSNIKDINTFFGPSAQNCCYEVNENFEENIIDNNLKQKTVIKKNDKTFFDIPLYNKLILNELGIENINMENNICTICNKKYSSYRRDKDKSGLQISYIILT